MSESPEARSALVTGVSKYIRISPLVLDTAGNVVPAEGYQARGYAPFDFYTAPVPADTVDSILGPNRSRGSGYDGDPKGPKFNLHTLFATLSPERPDQTLRFMEYYGYLFYNEAGANTAHEFSLGSGGKVEALTVFEDDLQWYRSHRSSGTSVLLKPVSMDGFLAEVWLFRWIVELGGLYSTGKSNAAIRECLSRGSQAIEGGQGPMWESLKPWLDDVFCLAEAHPFWAAQVVLRRIFGIQLEGARPQLAFAPTGASWDHVPDGRTGIPPVIGARSIESLFGIRHGPRQSPMSIGWSFDSLLSALYLMLYLDLTKGSVIRLCANKLCGNYFVPGKDKRADAEYCCTGCQDRAEKRRYWKNHPEKRPRPTHSSTHNTT